MRHGPVLLVVSAVWVASELVVGVVKRSRAGSSKRDRGSLWLLWTVIGVSTFAASTISRSVHAARIPYDTFWIGIALIIVGIIVRAIAIATLWRYFTIDVSIAQGHELIDRGIYTHIRHPAYTGALLSFLGLGFAFRNWISVALIAVASFAAFSYRVRVEESALIDHFGDRYREYMKRTKRFVRGIV